jgi:RNA polymerase sigma-70 factor (ECF subfamily)
MTMLATMTLPAPLLSDAHTRTGRPGSMDEARFEAFYRRHAGSVWSYLYRMTGNGSVADDLLQKTFFRFLRANPVLAGEEHLRRWIFRTATNLALDHFRETKRERARSGEAIDTPAPAMEGRDVLRHDMMKVFGELKPRERALLWLAHVEEADHEEIADAIGVRTGSVKVMLFRARKHLGELLTRKGMAPEGRR